MRVAEAAAAQGESMLATIGLGSCVAIVLHDASAQVGGLAHVLLPRDSMARDRANRAKFPASAVPLLVDEMRRRGAELGRIRAKIAGGASMFGNLLGAGGINIGERNVIAARAALDRAGIPVVADDTGSDYGRSVFFFVDDGRVEIRSLRRGSRVL